mgnify:FL=1
MPFWSVVVLQVLSFIFLFLFHIAHFEEVYLQIPFIFLEVIVVGLLLFKTEKRFFYLVWQFQVYLLVVFKILFRYQESFGGSFNPTAATTMIGLISFLEIMIIAGIIMKEKAVKAILFTLSSTTSLAVILIIFFIFREGLPAFTENDPVEFVTGSQWVADYEPAIDDEIEITLEIIDYHHDLIIPDQRIYMGTGVPSLVNVTLSNTGSKADTYEIEANGPASLDICLNCTTFYLEPREDTWILLNVTALEKGESILEITADSRNSSNSVTDSITIIGGENGINVWPEKTYLFMSDFGVARTPIWFQNTGKETDTFRITVTYIEGVMRPSVERTGEEWDWDTDSVNITLGSGEILEAMYLPRMLKVKNEAFDLTVTATSLADPSINDTIDIRFEYRDQNYFDIDTRDYKLDAGETLDIPFAVNVSNFKGSNFTIGIKEIEGPLDSFSLTFDRSILITNEDVMKEINLSGDGISEVMLEVSSSDTASIGDNITFTLIVERSGSEPAFSIGPMIVGTILVVIIALIIAVPLGLGAAIFLAEYSPSRLHAILRPIFELLAGIPSIIYGLWGYFTLAPFFRDHINQPVSDTIGVVIPFFRVTSDTPSSEGTLAVAGLVLAIMILPIIITLSEDSIRSVSRNLKEGSLALGTTKWQTIRGVILRKSRSGIISSVILAMGRAIGETMAVVMILRLSTDYPGSIFERAGSMTGTIAQTFGWSFDLDRTRHAVFGIAIILFVMVFALNILVYYVQYGNKNKKNKPHAILTRIIDKILKSKKDIAIKDVKVRQSIYEMRKSIRMVDPKWIYLREYISQGFFIFSAGLIALFLFLVLADVIFTGISSMELSYIYDKEVAGGLADGGFANAIVGSIQLTGLTLLISVPFSLGSAIYVQQYSGEGNIFTRIILFASDTLASTPSIVFGAFGFIFFSIELEFGLSMLSASLTLAIMVIPLLLRSSIEALKSIPREMSDGSLALGASKWQTIWNVILPPAMGGITSGVILSIGRAIGETAAILFTAGYALGFNNSIMSPVATMPNMIYNYYGLTAHAPELENKIYSCAFVLIVLILILNSIARLFQWRSNKMMKGKY